MRGRGVKEKKKDTHYVSRGGQQHGVAFGVKHLGGGLDGDPLEEGIHVGGQDPSTPLFALLQDVARLPEVQISDWHQAALVVQGLAHLHGKCASCFMDIVVPPGLGGLGNGAVGLRPDDVPDHLSSGSHVQGQALLEVV